MTVLAAAPSPGNGEPAPLIEALVREYFETFDTADWNEPNEVTDRNHELSRVLCMALPQSVNDAAAQLRFVRHQMVRFEGDSEGRIREPWIRDVHTAIEAVERFLCPDAPRSPRATAAASAVRPSGAA